MKRKGSVTWLARLAVLLAAHATFGSEHKDYPVTLKVLETEAISYKPDGTRTTTTCASNGSESITCDSSTISAAQHTDLVSFADGSDGKLYMISCVAGTGKRFLSGFGQGMAASAGAPTVSGCQISAGVYKARWDKGRLKVLHDKNGRLTEVTFAVLSSAPMPADATQSAKVDQIAEKTLLILSSTPAGADIEIDGVFVGQTPSSVPTLPGEHSIRINKSGYRPWERKITTAGGQVTIAAELDGN